MPKLLRSLNAYRNAYGIKLMRSGLTLFDNCLAYLLSQTPRRGPFFVVWDVTFQCNAKCAFCQRWSVPAGGELDTPASIKLLNDLARAGTCMISFNGGEPLLRRDCMQLISAAKKAGLYVNINTNGFLLNKRARELISLKVDSISVSVNSDQAESHDRERNLPGLFDRMMEGIEEVKRLRKTRIPNIKAKVIITRDNYKELIRIVDHWSALVDCVVLQPIHTCDTNMFITDEKHLLCPRDREQFRRIFTELFERYPQLDNKYHREIFNFFFNRDKLKERVLCSAGFAFIQIDPYGNIYSCNEYVRKLGDIKKADFKVIWNSPQFAEFRKIIRQKDYGCFCWYLCSGPFMAYLSPPLNLFTPIFKGRR